MLYILIWFWVKKQTPKNECIFFYVFYNPWNSLIRKICRIISQNKIDFSIALAKVSDWNSFWVNQNYSDSFRYLYPSQCESFRTNPKNVLYFVWWKTVKNQSNLIPLIPRHQSEWIRTNAKPSFQSRSIRFNPSSN